jgi:hypothetical protein
LALPCSAEINHRPDEDTPRAGVIYRCSICRLELTLDEAANRLTVAPLPDTRSTTTGRQ